MSRQSHFLAICFILSCYSGLPIANAQLEKNDLAKKAQTILKTNCYQCHGKDGSNEGGFNSVLEQPRLLASKKIIPGNTKGSKLYKRIVEEDMPPTEDAEGKPVKQRPSAEDITILKQWIDAGAPDFNPAVAKREFVSPTKILELIRDDLKTLDERDRKFIRYFTLTHLSNAGFSDDEMQSYRNALSKLVNSLSWGREIVVPRPIDPAKSILRINLTDYEWDEKTWEAILAANPYGITHPTEAAKECYRATQCKLPHVRGDWFVHSAARPPLYHTILKLPKTDKELEKDLRIDVAENIRKELVRRAGFNGSGVSQNNRLIERHKTGYGAYWKSYDFAGKVDRKNLFQHPIGPGDAQEFFEHDGGEIIFNLPNQLQAYLLVDAKGNRIDKGPLNVVSDPKQKDRAVVNGVSCMSCHAKGMIDKSDQIREAVLKAKDSYTEEEVATIKRLYPAKEDFDKLLRDDAEHFKKAVEATGAKLSATEPIVALSLRFEDELDLNLAAAEAGVTPEEFFKGLEKAPTTLGRAFASLQAKGGTVPRDVMVKEFGGLMRVLELGEFQAGATGSIPDSQPNEPSRLQLRFSLNAPFFQKTSTLTVQNLKMQGAEDIKQEQEQTYYFKFTPIKADGDKLVIQSEIEGIRVKLQNGGKTEIFDSTADNPEIEKSPSAELARASVGSTFTLTLNLKAMMIEKVEGREAFLEKLIKAKPQMKDLLQKMYTDEVLKQMIGSTFEMIPDMSLKKGGTWASQSILNLSMLGTHQNTFKYTFMGGDAKNPDLAVIDVEQNMTYKPPLESDPNQPFKIKDANLRSGDQPKGKILFNTKLGRLESMELSMQLSGKLTIEIGGTTSTVDLTQNQQTTVRVASMSLVPKRDVKKE